MGFLPNVPGQDLARRYFRRALETGRLSHAYLFLGPEGAGKRHFARELAKALFCERGVACGDCLGCRKVDHGNQPAVSIQGPAEGKSVIDIDTVRALSTRSHFKADHIQISVLERAELLSEPAANALLKTLEEPPGRVLLILTAQASGTLLPTIVSRCHRIFFTGSHLDSAVKDPEIEEWLREARGPEFFSRYDLRPWLSRMAPEDAGGVRPQVRYFLDLLIGLGRARLVPEAESSMDRTLRYLDRLLDLRHDLDRNVHPELILERTLAAYRSAAGFLGS